MIMPGMIRLRRGTVLEVVAERPGAVEISVEVDEGTDGHPSGVPGGAIAYPALVGPVRPGDRVLLNTTAVDLGLGTGGLHFVVAVEGRTGTDAEPLGRTMKLRYTPLQVQVLAAEEEEGPHRDALRSAHGLEGTPVVWVPLHSMIGPVAAGSRSAGAARIAYVMTGGAALPAPLSRLAAELRRTGLLEAVITCGQAFGGDLETVNTFTGLLAARWAVGADVVVVGDGPGNTGTDTVWGATAIESAMSLNAVAILGGRPVASLRVSFADPRDRHRVVSHHSLTALSNVAMAPVHVAVPAMDDEGHRQAVWAALRQAKLDERHQLVEVNGEPALDVLAELGIESASMGREVADDPEFFLAAGAAGVLAGRMASGDRAWRSRTRGG
jgi:Protein of unknown function (DUF3866)